MRTLPVITAVLAAGTEIGIFPRAGMPGLAVTVRVRVRRARKVCKGNRTIASSGGRSNTIMFMLAVAVAVVGVAQVTVALRLQATAVPVGAVGTQIPPIVALPATAETVAVGAVTARNMASQTVTQSKEAPVVVVAVEVVEEGIMIMLKWVVMVAPVEVW